MKQPIPPKRAAFARMVERDMRHATPDEVEEGRRMVQEACEIFARLVDQDRKREKEERLSDQPKLLLVPKRQREGQEES